MKVQHLNNTFCGAKNTFLEKSKKALAESQKIIKESRTPLAQSKSANFLKDSAYYKSLHLEAIARRSNIRNIRAWNEIDKIDLPEKSIVDFKFKDAFKMYKLLIIANLSRFNREITFGDARQAFPERFEVPDDINSEVQRFYKY